MKLKKKKGKKEYKQRDDVMPPAHHAHSDTQTHTHTHMFKCIYEEKRQRHHSRFGKRAFTHIHKKKKKRILKR